MRIALVALTVALVALGAHAVSSSAVAGGLPGRRPSDGPVVAPSFRVGQALARRAAGRPDEPVAAWVFFADRAGSERDPEAYGAARRALSPRSLDRRARRGVVGRVIASDLPVHQPYVAALVARGARLRGTSRWLNAASVEAPPWLLVELARLPFVARVDLVPRGRRIEPVDAPEAVSMSGTPAAPGADASAADAGAEPSTTAALVLAPGDRAYYGGSFRQLEMMQVPALHALGLSGAGVLVCVLDTGFRLTHRAYSGLDVLATRDFIHGDTNVDDEAGQDVTGQASHGTETLSCIAGSKPGTFSGAAFAATVALAKTEDVASETPVEMDYWQFGAEWADSLGADVISSSLGYYQFDDTTESYVYEDLDGRTTVVTLAAVEAMRRGITVVTAAGNEGDSPWHYIIAPADADTVITSGAVDSSNVVTAFSSRGPTADRRIKPDVTAMGRKVLTAAFNNDSIYVRLSGTSFSTPLTAGLVALLLEAHPAWSPFDVAQALRQTALNHSRPNYDIGWGLVQGLAAVSFDPGSVGVAGGPAAAGGLAISAGPNPARIGAGTTIRFTAPGATRATLEVLDLAGRRRARLYDGAPRAPQALRWAGNAGDGARLPAGVYWIRLLARGGDVGAGGTPAPEESRSRAIRVVLLP